MDPILEGWIVEPEDFNCVYTATLKAQEPFVASDFIPICAKCVETGQVVWQTTMTQLEFNYMTNKCQLNTRHARLGPVPSKAYLLAKYIVRERMRSMWMVPVVLHYILI